MLKKLCTWLYQDDFSLDWTDFSLSRSQLEQELKTALDEKRRLLAEIRVCTFESCLSKDRLSVKSATLSKHERYLRMLIFFKDHWPSDTLSQNPYKMILTYCFANEDTKLLTVISKAKILELYRAYLECDFTAAALFFDAMTSSIPAELRLQISYLQTKSYDQYLQEHLSEEKNPLGLVKLFQSHVSNTELFAACLLWLNKKTPDVDSILKSGLLQHFLFYNLSDLHAEDSAVLKLYRLIKKFPQLHPLVQRAGNTRCELTAFHAYALDGTLHHDNELEQVDEMDYPFECTLKKDHLWALFKVFGVSFLAPLLTFYMDKPDEICKAFLKELLNNTLSLEERAHFIKLLTIEYPPQILAEMASLMEDGVVYDMAIVQKNAFFLILPYKVHLRHLVKKEDIEHVLVEHQQNDRYEQLAYLISLYQAFHHHDLEIAKYLYEAMIDIAMECPRLIDDEIFYSLLLDYEHRNEVIAKCFNRLQATLKEAIQSLASQKPFLTEHYYALEDIWLATLRKMILLQEVADLPEVMPDDKYRFQTNVAEVVFQHNPKMSFKDFLQTIAYEPVLDDELVNDCEYLAVEMLTTIDHPPLQHQIMRFLQNKYEQDKYWLYKKYDKSDVFTRAIQKENISFLAWVITHQLEPDAKSLTKVIKTALKENHWRVVRFFCEKTPHKLDYGLLKTLFLTAAKLQDGILLKKLRAIAVDKFPKDVTERAFLTAVENQDLETMRFLSELEAKSPCKTIKMKGFKLALAQNHREMIRFFDATCLDMRTGVEALILQCCKQNELVQLESLLELPYNKPRPILLERALKKAVEKGHQAIFKTLFAALKPFDKNLDHVFMFAAQEGQLDMVKLFFTHGRVPATKSIHLALRKAYKRGFDDLIVFLKDAQNRHQAGKESTHVDKPKPVPSTTTHSIGFFKPPSRLVLSPRALSEEKSASSLSPVL